MVNVDKIPPLGNNRTESKIFSNLSLKPRGDTMPEDRTNEKASDELKKLASIATDMQLANKIRVQAINQLSMMATHEALLVLLNLAANDKLNTDERELALKKASNIVKKGR
jgi:hypothetical protein